MIKWEKKFLDYRLEEEKKVLKELEEHYEAALAEVEKVLKKLDDDDPVILPVVIRRREYQRYIKQQIQAALDKLHANEYETIEEFVNDSYTDGFVGVMYSLHGQGIPLLLPVDRNLVVKAVQMETKLNKPLYESLGADTKKLQKVITNEITRGIIAGKLYSEIMRNIANAAKIPMKRARTIVRTEAGRVQEEATMDAARKSKKSGADVVKQWNAILDAVTRLTHKRLDGQIREIDEPFEIDGKKAMQPHGFGIAEEDINCRCTLLIRARAAMDKDELNVLRERARKAGVDKSQEFEEFKKKYLDATKD